MKTGTPVRAARVCAPPGRLKGNEEAQKGGRSTKLRQIAVPEAQVRRHETSDVFGEMLHISSGPAFFELILLQCSNPFMSKSIRDGKLLSESPVHSFLATEGVILGERVSDVRIKAR